MTPEYTSMKQRIDQAEDDLKKLSQLETSLVRVYNAGCLKVNEFKRLDQYLFTKIAKLTCTR